MSDTKAKINIRKLCYYIFIFLILLYYAFRQSVLDYTFVEFTLYLSIPFLMIKVILERYTLKESIEIFSLMVLGCICTFQSNKTSILIAFCVVIGMKNINYASVLKIVFWVRLFTTILLVILALSGQIQNNIIIREGNITRIRNSLGYAHPNVFGIYCFVLISLWFILYGQKKWKFKVIVSFMIGIWQYRLTQSRTALMLILLFLVLVLISKIKNMSQYIKKCTSYSIVVGFLISFIIPQLIKISIVRKMDILFSARLSLSKSYLDVYGLRIFGTPIVSIVGGGQYWLLDSGYLNLSIGFGLIASIVYIAIYISMCKKINSNNIYIYITSIIFAVYGLIENVLDSFLYCYLWVLMGSTFYMKYIPQIDDVKHSKEKCL